MEGKTLDNGQYGSEKQQETKYGQASLVWILRVNHLPSLGWLC